jgi:nitroimidazol reductase NimA-like FMN-containing flavoprotein (pyridoxamine 5'-phosphate oxidase superfamily)
MSSLSREARAILNEGTLCYLAAPSPAGPHVTPVVFVLDGGRVWGTTGRGTTKAKLWRTEPVAGGLVSHGDRQLAFRGPVTLYDALDPSTWSASLWRGPRVASASARFSLKNARFFAGYARDATHVPLAWTPPARVIFSIDVAAGAVLDGSKVRERWGTWADAVEGMKAFRTAAPGLSHERLPESVRDLLGESGEGVIGLAGELGPVVLPAAWRRSKDALYARVASEPLALAGPRRETSASLVVDRASAWRASRMRGVLLRGPASVYRPDEMTRGRAQLEAHAGDLAAGGSAIRIRPRSAVWWSGWTSGTVRNP